MSDAECIATIVGIRFHYQMIGATPQSLRNIDALLARFQELVGVTGVQAWTERPEPTPGEPTVEPESE